MANINKQHFLLAGSCAVVRSVFSRSSFGKIGEGKEKIKRREILRKVLFAQAQVVSLKRGDGSGAAVAAHGVSGGERKARNTRRNIAEHRTSIGSNKCIC